MVVPSRKNSIQLMKIVLDTNCLVNVIMPGSYNNDVWQAFRANKYVLCVTNEILSEYHEILTKRYNIVIANTVLKELVETSNVERVNPSFRFNLITTDPDDNKFVIVPSRQARHLSSATTVILMNFSNTTSRRWMSVRFRSSWR